MRSKYQEFADDVVSVDNKTADDHCSGLPVDTTPSEAAASAAMAAGASIGNIQTSVPLSISASNQPVIIVQAPKLQRSFERYPSKAAVIFGAIQVCNLSFHSTAIRLVSQFAAYARSAATVGSRKSRSYSSREQSLRVGINIIARIVVFYFRNTHVFEHMRMSINQSKFRLHAHTSNFVTKRG